jgi:hypothetical protein
MSGLYAVVSNNTVSNVVLWDGVSQYDLPTGASIVAIPTGIAVSAGWTFDGTNFNAPVVAVALATAQATQALLLDAACQAQIYAGFTSTALGTAYTYPAKDTDQQNLTASVLSSLMPGLASTWTTPFWCEDSNGNWAYVVHTAAQIQQVGQDGKNAILTAMQQLQTLNAQVSAATTVAAVQAITW